MSLAMVLLAASASAAPVAVSTETAYWSRVYSIPSSYAQYSLAFQSRDAAKERRRIEGLLLGLGAKEIAVPRSIRAQGEVSGYWPQPNQSVWGLSPSSAASIATRLAKEPDLYHFKRTGGGVPSFPELYDKRDGLTREAAALGGRLEGLPAARGLLEVELTTLSRLIVAHERAAAQAFILTTFDGPAQTPPVLLELDGGRVVPRSRIYLPDDPALAEVRLSTVSADPRVDWNRTFLSVCGPPGHALMVMAFPSEEIGRELSTSRALHGGGRPLQPPCVNSAFPQMNSYRSSPPMYFEFPSAKALARFQRKIQGEASLVFYNSDDGSMAGLAAMHERRRLLLDELSSRASEFANAPMTRSLMMAEASRLEPFDQQFEAARDHPSIEIIAVSPR